MTRDAFFIAPFDDSALTVPQLAELGAWWTLPIKSGKTFWHVHTGEGQIGSMVGGGATELPFTDLRARIYDSPQETRDTAYQTLLDEGITPPPTWPADLNAPAPEGFPNGVYWNDWVNVLTSEQPANETNSNMVERAVVRVRIAEAPDPDAERQKIVQERPRMAPGLTDKSIGRDAEKIEGARQDELNRRREKKDKKPKKPKKDKAR